MQIFVPIYSAIWPIGDQNWKYKILIAHLICNGSLWYFARPLQQWGRRHRPQNWVIVCIVQFHVSTFLMWSQFSKTQCLYGCRVKIPTICKPNSSLTRFPCNTAASARESAVANQGTRLPLTSCARVMHTTPWFLCITLAPVQEWCIRHRGSYASLLHWCKSDA